MSGRFGLRFYSMCAIISRKKDVRIIMKKSLSGKELDMLISCNISFFMRSKRFMFCYASYGRCRKTPLTSKYIIGFDNAHSSEIDKMIESLALAYRTSKDECIETLNSAADDVLKGLILRIKRMTNHFRSHEFSQFEVDAQMPMFLVSCFVTLREKLRSENTTVQ